MSARRLTTSQTDNLVTVLADTRTTADPEAAALVDSTEVLIYWHTPEVGTAYLVVEVDGDSPVKIVRHDTTIFEAIA